jgi:uncharacterized damage-inducible protein DinB
MLSTTMLATMFDYNAAMNARILERAAQLSDAQLDMATDYSQGSIRKTLTHLLNVEYGWRAQCQGIDARKQPWPMQPTATIAEMQGFQQAESERARAYITGASEDDLAATIVLRGASGKERTITTWQIVTHILLHSMQHRSELALWLTQHGQSPGDLDFIFFV